MNPKVNQLLNARHDDLQNELGLYLSFSEVSDKYDTGEDLVDEMRVGLIDKFGVDLDDIREEEELEDDESVTTGMIDDAMKTALSETYGEMKVAVTLDRFIASLKNAGATEDELEGIVGFKTRLEGLVFDRYEITEEEIKELTEVPVAGIVEESDE